MIRLVEGAERQKTPNEIALNILLVGLTIIFVLRRHAATDRDLQRRCWQRHRRYDYLVALFVTLIPTTIGALLSRHRHRRYGPTDPIQRAGDGGARSRGRRRCRHAPARQDRHDHAGNRQATEFKPLQGVSEQELADAAQLASLADETPEGRSIVVLAKEKYGIRGRELAEMHANFIPFTAQTRMSGVEIDGRRMRKGAVDAIRSDSSRGAWAAPGVPSRTWKSSDR